MAFKLLSATLVQNITTSVLLLSAASVIYAKPANMGTFTITSGSKTNPAKGTYITAEGGTGTFTLERIEVNGYANAISFQGGANGIEARNNSDTSVGADKDKFVYRFTITPDNDQALHTIKIGQASYDSIGNSEIARHTLSYTPNNKLAISSKAIIQNNSSVPYYYNAMGDYFMGKVVDNSSTQLLSEQFVFEPQLRVDSSNGGASDLYYYTIPGLNGAGSSSPYTPTKNTKGEVSLSINNGVLPPNPTFANIFKASRAPNRYLPLNVNNTIDNGGSYVSYGIANTDSNYVIAVQNATSVKLTYEGIMNGNLGIPRAVIGETFNEWISFGVESEPYYRFTGTVFDDNGGITAIDPQQTGAPYAGNTDYFNGQKDASELGITSSNISLTNCDDIVYSMTSTDINGNYQILVPSSQIPNTVCVTESKRPADYSISTSPSSKTITIDNNRIDQTIVNFGHVVQDNAALVLKKYQYVHECNPALDYSSIAQSDDPKAGFSTQSINGIAPGQCIAYKITATNRANMTINDFEMRDPLQKKGVKNATVTSVLAQPERKASDYADNLKTGDNGTIITNTISIPKRAKRSFYFNTKYTTSASF